MLSLDRSLSFFLDALRATGAGHFNFREKNKIQQPKLHVSSQSQMIETKVCTVWRGASTFMKINDVKTKYIVEIEKHRLFLFFSSSSFCVITFRQSEKNEEKKMEREKKNGKCIAYMVVY